MKRPLSLVVLLGRTQQVYIIPRVDDVNGLGYQRGASDVVSWLEKRLFLLKDEVLLVESQLERMRHEHILIKEHLRDLGHLVKKQS
ncbi:hypothetical protein V2J09_007307 [Rumex salicifolius]